jgi:cytochrome c oxidase subunit 2
MTGSAIVNGPIEGHLDIILNGKNIMPAWKDVLNDVDIAAVIAYERNALGNSVGDSIQPSAVKASR